jgi:hypothetical protein
MHPQGTTRVTVLLERMSSGPHHIPILLLVVALILHTRSSARSLAFILTWRKVYPSVPPWLHSKTNSMRLYFLL